MQRDVLRFSILFLVLGTLVLGLNTVEAGGKQDLVKITAKPSKLDAAGKQTVVLSLEIKEGWYIYANPVANEVLENSRTLVTAKGATIKVDYPPGKEKSQILGEKEITFRAYQERVDIKAELQRPAGAGPIKLIVHFNACDKDKCLRQQKEEVTIE